jgi:hypothetical protein
MQLRYDFVGDKLDLSRFQKQAIREIGSMRRLTYDLYVKGYKINVDIATPDDSNAHQVTIRLFELKRDENQEIVVGNQLIPANDLRFKELKDVTSIFPIDQHEANFESNNTAKTVQELCSIIRIIYKINNLKAFL